MTDTGSPVISTDPPELKDEMEQEGFRAEIVGSSDDQYHADAMRTAAGPEVFHPHNHNVRDLILAMAKFILASRQLDAAKSALFYGKTKEVNIDDLTPIIASGGTDGYFDYALIYNPQFLHATLGIMSEAGEIGDDVLKALSGRLEDVDNIVRESGDIDWFQELLAEAVGVSVYEGRCRNIYRLRQRFPEAFSEADAIARADEAEDAPAVPLRGSEDEEDGA